MKPNRPRVVTSSRNHITIGWDSCDFLILKQIEGTLKENEGEENDSEKERRWYALERKDRILGWSISYIGFKTQTKVGPLTPEDYYEFRLKVKTRHQESDWSDTLFAATKDDVISVAQFHRVVENGPITNLRKILGQRLAPLDVPNRYGQTAMRLATSKNNTNFMGILINHGADVENAEPGSERTLLMTAASMGHLDAVNLLLEKGSSWETRDRHGLTAFNYAVDNSQLAIVKLAVANGIDMLTRDNFGWTPLMRGVTLKSSVEVLSYLLENGSDPNDRDDRRQTVLMQAVLSGRPEVVNILLKKRADSKIKNIYGHSAYDMAKHSFNEAIVKMTVLLGSEIEDNSGKKKKALGSGNE